MDGQGNGKRRKKDNEEIEEIIKTGLLGKLFLYYTMHKRMNAGNKGEKNQLPKTMIERISI